MRKERRGSPRGPATTEAVAGGVWPQPQGHLESWDLEEAGSLPPPPPRRSLQRKPALRPLPSCLCPPEEGKSERLCPKPPGCGPCHGHSGHRYCGVVRGHRGITRGHRGIARGHVPRAVHGASHVPRDGHLLVSACRRGNRGTGSVHSRADRGGWGGVELSELWAVLAPSEAGVGTPALSCHRELLSV